MTPAAVDSVDGASSIALSPDGRWAYVASTGGGIAQYAVDPVSGTLTALDPGVVAGPSSPTGVAVSPDGRNLYVAGYGTGDIAQYAIDQSTGEVSPLTPASVDSGYNTIGVAVSPDGKTVYAGNYTTMGVSQFARAADGKLTAHAPLQVGDGWVTRPFAEHAPAVRPDGLAVYAGGDLDAGDFILAPFGAAATGKLTSLPTLDLATAAPRGPAVSPDGRTLYQPTNTSIVRYGITAASGTPTPSATFPADAYDMVVTPRGGHAFASSGASVRRYAVEAATGALTALAAGPTIAGTDLRGIATTPNQGPTAGLAVTPRASGSASSFDASGSSDPDGAVASYVWDFGDGSAPRTTAGPQVEHVYATAGTYSATLRVIDSEGCSDRIVFTGQTAHCNGGSTAVASRQVVVAAPPVVQPPAQQQAVVTIVPPPPPPLPPRPAARRRFGLNLARLAQRGQARVGRSCPLRMAAAFHVYASEPAAVAVVARKSGRTIASKRLQLKTGRTRIVLCLNRTGQRLARPGRRLRPVSAVVTVTPTVGGVTEAPSTVPVRFTRR